MGNNRNVVLSVVRGLAIILVVYGHVIQRSMEPFGEDFFLNPAFKTIYTFHMPLFVFLSGWVMVYSLGRRSIADVFRSKVQTLIIPFISWAVLGAISLYMLDVFSQEEGSVAGFFQILLNELLLRPTIWILVTLFVCSGLMLLSLKLSKCLGKSAFLLFYVLILLIPYNEYCTLSFIKWLYPVFVAGYFISQSGLTIKTESVRLAVLIISMVLFVYLLSFWVKTDYIYINKMYLVLGDFLADATRILYRYILAFLGISITFCIGAYFSRTKLCSILDEIGVYSLDIYLVQRYVIEGLYPRIVSGMNIRFDYNSPVFLFCYVPVITFLAVYLCMLTSKIIIRRNIELNKLLLGGRS